MGDEVEIMIKEKQGALLEPLQPWRANFIPAPHFYKLNQACAIINQAFGNGFGCYLVGSSREHRDYRDVDVRLILDDDEYERLFGAGGSYTNALWSLMCVTISDWLSQQSGLPVDFQIQQQTQANVDHPGAGRRSALGIFLDYPGERPTEVVPNTSVGVCDPESSLDRLK